MTEKPELENDYGSNVDALVDSMPPVAPPTEIEDAHDQLMRDPKYAVAIHGHQINKITDYLEEIVNYMANLPKYTLVMIKGTRYFYPTITKNIPFLDTETDFRSGKRPCGGLSGSPGFKMRLEIKENT